MPYARWIGTFRSVPISSVAGGTKTRQLVGTDGRHRLALQNAGCTEPLLKTLAREEPVKVYWLRAGELDRDPSLAWNENNRARACHGALVANSYSGTALLQNEDLLGVMVHVEWDRHTGGLDFGHN